MSDAPCQWLRLFIGRSRGEQIREYDNEQFWEARNPEVLGTEPGRFEVTVAIDADSSPACLAIMRDCAISPPCTRNWRVHDGRRRHYFQGVATSGALQATDALKRFTFAVTITAARGAIPMPTIDPRP